MSSAKERIAAMDDFQVMRAFEDFAQQILVSSETSLDALKQGVPGPTRALPDWRAVEAMTPEQAEQALAPKDAAPTARRVLTHLADDPTFGPALEKFFSTYRDDALVGDVILTVGLVASMVMVVSSLSFEATFKNVKIVKHALDVETVKAILEPFAKMLVPTGGR